MNTWWQNNMEADIGPILSLMGIGISGLIAWVWALWKAHTDFKLKVSEDYMKASSINELKGEIHALRDVVYRIAVKMEVPVFSEPYRRERS